MATIRRGTIVNGFTESLKQDIAEGIPNKTSDKVVLTYDYKNTKYCDYFRTAVGTAAIATVPSDKDLYLCGLQMNANAFEQGGDGSNTITATIQGAVRTIAAITLMTAGVATGSCDSDVLQLNFNPPLKIDRGTTLNHVRGATGGSCRIWGYFIDG